MHWKQLEEQLKTELGNDFKMVSTHAVGGGDIHQAFQIHSKQGNFFLKANSLASAPLFTSEAQGLKEMQASLSLRVPQVIAQGETDQQAWLLLEFIPLCASGDDFQRGKDLAMMHHFTQKQFGFHANNYIGHTLQPNNWTDNWVEFYGKQRLKHQLDLALNAGIDQAVFEQGQQLIEQLPKFFTAYAPEASLLHGDLWGGNASFCEDGEAIFYDPACYYGDREADLAMTELFGGFSDDFYKGYHHVFPIDDGYQLRKPLYNLYHVLNHYNLFGGSYARQAERMIKQLLTQIK